MLKKKWLPAAALGVLTVAALSALAQTPTTPTSSGSMAPAGQGPGSGTAGSEIPRGSTQSRPLVKAQTRQASSTGTLQPAGEAPDPIGGSTTTRKLASKAKAHHHRSRLKHKPTSGPSRSMTSQGTPVQDPMTEPKK